MTAYHEDRISPVSLRHMAERLLARAQELEQKDNPPPKPKPTMRSILLEACQAHAMSEWQLTGPCRAASLFKVRAEAMRVMHDEYGYSLPQIGITFGGRDHTTVLSAVRRARAWKVLAG